MFRYRNISLWVKKVVGVKLSSTYFLIFPCGPWMDSSGRCSRCLPLLTPGISAWRNRHEIPGGIVTSTTCLNSSAKILCVHHQMNYFKHDTTLFYLPTSFKLHPNAVFLLFLYNNDKMVAYDLRKMIPMRSNKLHRTYYS